VTNTPDPNATELVVSVRLINPDGTVSDREIKHGVSTRGGTGKGTRVGPDKPSKNKQGNR